MRVAEDRAPTPSAGTLDSQSVPSAVMVSQSVGYDGGKKIKGRKRFTLVDTLGLLVAVKVVAASVPEREGAKQLLSVVRSGTRTSASPGAHLGGWGLFGRGLLQDGN